MKNKKIWIGLGIVIIYLLPYIIFGSNTHVRIHDSLDSDIVKFKTLAESGQMFASLDAAVPQMMNGVPRASLMSEFNGMVWLYTLFQPYTAYVINQFIMHLLAFLGMYLLLRKHFIRENKYQFLALGAAAAFAILPFYASAGLSVAGLPLVLFAFMNIRARMDSLKDWLILLLVPFYSFFEFSYFFLMILLGLAWLIELIRYKKMDSRYLLSLVFFTLISLLVEYRLFIGMFLDSSFTSHRIEFHEDPVSLFQSMKSAVSNFIFGQIHENHAASLQQYFIAVSVIIAIFLVFRKKLKEIYFMAAIVAAGLISIWFGFWEWSGWTFMKQHITLLNSFDFSRFNWLHPLLWYLIFGLALKIIVEQLRSGRNIAYVLLALQIIFLFYNHEAIHYQADPTYKQFYSEPLFAEIKDYIGEDPQAYRVVSIGLHPSIARYNGFYTLDAYLVNYSLTYKHEFRSIIKNELNKNKDLKAYYDNWGSRCYVFVDELGMDFSYTKASNTTIKHLELNTKGLKEMGGAYVLSAVEIKNASENSLGLKKIFESPASPWRIFLYQVL